MAMRSLIILFAPVAALLAQPSSVVSLSNGVQVGISINFPKDDPPPLAVELDAASGNSFYRIFRDENDLVVFAYELAVERSEDGDQFRVTAKSATTEFASRFPNADGGKPPPTLSEPLVSPMLNSGDHFAIDVPTDPGLGLKLVDTVEVEINERGLPAADPGDRASVPLRLESLKVAVNGVVVSPGGPGAIVSGRYLMFYLPGHGGYFFSTSPVARFAFAKIGMVEFGKLRFVLDNESYECQSAAPILTKADRGELWIYHDPDYKPAGNWTSSDPAAPPREEFFTAASDSVNWWLR
jgi:hypothetical protein